MRKLLPFLIAIVVVFTHLNGEPVAINPESVSSEHPTPPGYSVGTMIDLQNGSEIVKEPSRRWLKSLRPGCMVPPVELLFATPCLARGTGASEQAHVTFPTDFRRRLARLPQ